MAVTSEDVVFTILAEMPDPRVKGRSLHRLVDILFVAICAAIAGADSWVEVEEFGQKRLAWLRQFVPLENGIPSHDTFGRVFRILDSAAFAGVMSAWMQHLQEQSEGVVIALDGKTMRRSFDAASGKAALHIVSAWATNNGILLGQYAVDTKSNEITAIPKLLDYLQIKGATVTIDAMGCQKAIARKIRQNEADYVLHLKDNQEKLHHAVQQAFLTEGENDFRSRKVRRLRQTTKGHGREECREYFVMPAPAQLPAKRSWLDLRSIAMVVRQRTAGGKQSTEVSYYISSLPPRVRRFAHAVRSHWEIENSLHWSLDVTFSEDNSRIRKGNGPETTALLRRVVLSLLKQDISTKRSIRVKRFAAACDPSEILWFLSGSKEI